MGTNYYGKKKIHYPMEFVVYSENSLRNHYEHLCNLVNESKIHLGEKSAGWKFIAQYNNGKYYKTKQEFLDFCKTIKITDEYGENITYDQFQQIVNKTKGKSCYQEAKDDGDNDTIYSLVVVDDFEFMKGEFS